MAASPTQSIQPLLPAGLSMPKPLKRDRNFATNWKKFKRSWDNYEILANKPLRSTVRNSNISFMHCNDALEMFEGVDFSSEEDRTKYDVVAQKFGRELCLGETNETYERFIFNSRDKSDEESVDQYVTSLRKLAQTCNFCACLHDSL